MKTVTSKIIRSVVTTILFGIIVVTLAGCGSAVISSTNVVASSPNSNKTTVSSSPVSNSAIAANASVSVIPSVEAVKSGDTFDLTIRAANDQPSRGIQFSLKWDPAKVECISVDQGSYFKDFATSHGGDVFVMPSNNPAADNDNGIFPKTSSDPLARLMIAMNGAQDAGGTPLGVTGSGNVFILHMKVKDGASGQVNFNLSQVILSDANIDHPADMKPAVIDGKITINQ